MDEPVLSVSLLGVPRVECRGAQVTFPTRKTAALLFYLIMAREPVSRERLVGLLFPEVGEKRARAALRQTLYALRRSLAEAGNLVTAGRSFMSLSLEGVFLDVAFFENLLTAGNGSDAECARKIEEALVLYRGDFLEGFYVADEEFHKWHDVRREHYRALFLEYVRKLLSILPALGGGARAIRWAHRALEIEPGLEEAHIALMRYYASTGRRELALRQFDLCRRWLHKDLGLSPSPALCALRDELEADGPR
jgi:DNA-binding SARP family transcriptional activator